jgi:hypothetical protein
MGHALGLQHTSGGAADVYSNFWDAMSYCLYCRTHDVYGPVRQHPIAYHKDRLGWIPAARKYVAQRGRSATITLEQLAQPQTGNYLMAQIGIPGSDRFYTVEARRRVGYDKNLPTDAVVIHLIDPGHDPVATVMQRSASGEVSVNSAWIPGMTLRDAEHGISVTVERATATGFVVTIKG